MPYAHFTYTVIGHAVVAPSDFSAAVDNVGYSRLVLSACTPLFSAAKRLLVFAQLTRTVPVGAARRLPGGGAVRPIQAPSRAALERNGCTPSPPHQRCSNPSSRTSCPRPSRSETPGAPSPHLGRSR